MGVQIGTRVGIIDEIDPTLITSGTVRYIEVDDEFPDLYFIYVRADHEELNVNTDPKINTTFWKIIDLASEYLILDYEVGE